MNRWQSFIRLLAHLIGKVRLHLGARWIPPLGGFLLTIILVAITDVFFAKTTLFPFVELNKNWHHHFGDWLNIWMILAIYTIAWVLIWSLQARSRMIVERFANYVGADFDQAAEGASMLLLIKLAQLQDLYQTVDEQRAISTAALERFAAWGRSLAVDAAITVDTMEAFLKNAVTAQSTLNVGPLQIPIGVLLSLIGHVAQGPRIISSLHKDQHEDGPERLILVAQARRNGKSFAWRVERELAAQQSRNIDLTSMLDELAYRIFTDMTLRATVRWRAAEHFAEGLRAYRECLRTPKDRIGHLRLAEECFIETLTEDTQYTLAHYNLGVVLTELQRSVAATAAFERAIAEDTRATQAYYALALGCYQDKQFYRACQLCKRVIELKPDVSSIAKAYQLRALALGEQDNQHNANDLNANNHNSNSQNIRDAIKNCKCAIKYARKALYRAEMTQQDDLSGNDRVVKAEALLGVCIGSLAKLYAPGLLSSETTLATAIQARDAGMKLPRLKKAEQLLNRALLLRSSDPSYDVLYHWQLGKICSFRGNWKDAAQHLRIAVRAVPGCIEYLADLIFVQAKALEEKEKQSRGKAGKSARPRFQLKFLEELRVKTQELEAQAREAQAPAEEKEPPDQLDWEYEDFLFQTLLDLISATPKETANKVLATALEAYQRDVPQGAGYSDKYQRIRMIQTFLQFGYGLQDDTSEEKLNAMNTEQLLACDRRYEQQYAMCNDQCYIHKEMCKRASSAANHSPNVDKDLCKINKLLCLSEVILARGRVKLQLSRGHQSGADPLQELQELLAHFEQDLIDAHILTKYNMCIQPAASALSWDWELGQILSTLAMLYDDLGRRKHEMGVASQESKLFEQSKDYYYAAIQLLQKYPRGSSVQSLRSSLVSVLLQRQDRQEALKIAQQSVTLDAMNYKTYEILGQVFFTCEDFSSAVETWKQAIARQNTTEVGFSNPDLYMKLGRAYVALAQSRHGICLNDEQCQDALRYLNHALKCCTDDHAQERLQIYYALGYLHITRGEYDHAAEYLRLTQSFRLAFYTSTFYLAYIHLRQHDYDAAFRQFHDLHVKLEEEKDHLPQDPDAILEQEDGGHICVNEMRALALWGQAYIHAERDIDLEDGLRMANHACILAEPVAAEKLQFPSRYLHCKGWLLFKLDQLEPLEPSYSIAGRQTSNGKKAIEILLEAAKREALPEIYFHLAQACQARLQQLSAASERQRLLANIRAYCQHAHDLNADDANLRQHIDDLLKSLPA